MLVKKKIALLNFPLDKNYGGNLQRYALMRVLEGLGCYVTHISTRLLWKNNERRSFLKWVKFYIKLLMGKVTCEYYPAWLKNFQYKRELSVILPFYEKYIVHTKPIYDKKDLPSKGFDVYMVGSDQVWRRSMSGQFPYSTMFFDFVSEESALRIAYGVSLGVDRNELSMEDLRVVTPLYQKFSAVSVREEFALKKFDEYHWLQPCAIKVLDPTLLLQKGEYCDLIKNRHTRHHKGIFCYVLDMDDEKMSVIKGVVSEKHDKPYFCGLNERVSIEQWLRNIKDANFVITDSYHGLLFSIIFNKPFLVLKNNRRGNERIQSVLSLLEIDNHYDGSDWGRINEILEIEKRKSLDFLLNALSIEA